MPDPADYRLYRSQTAVMAAIRQAVANGYRYYLVATTPEEKALGAVAKLHERYKVLLSPEARRARKEAGMPTPSHPERPIRPQPAYQAPESPVKPAMSDERSPLKRATLSLQEPYAR